MFDALAEVEINETLHGVGTLSCGEVVLPVASFSLARAKHKHTSEWSFTAHVAEEHWDRLENITGAEPEGQPIKFVGFTDGRQEIMIPLLFWTKQIRGRLDAEVTEWYRDLKAVPLPPSSQFITLKLTETPLALSEINSVILDWNGEMRAADNGSKRTPVVWQSAIGEVRFSRRYDYEKVIAGGTKSTLQVPIPTFSCNLEDECCHSDIDDLSRRFDAATQDALRVLSFLSRRHVRWFRMTVGSRWQNENGSGISEVVWNRSVGGTPANKETHPIINPRRVPPEQLNTMIARYMALPWKDAASSAIVYLIESHQSSFVEARLSNAFTALEAMISGIGDVDQMNNTLGASQFSRLSTKLKADVRAFGVERNMSESNIQEIINKLPELRRRPIVNQVIDRIEHLQVPWQDLWPPNTELRTAIKQAFARRNRFVHAGKLESGRQAHVDAARIHALAERMLFLSIGGDVDWQDFRSSEHLDNFARLESA